MQTRSEQDADGGIRAHCEQADYAAATQLLLLRYRRSVFAYLSVRVRDQYAAEEVFSLFSEDVWRGLPGFRFQCKVQSWVFAVARNALSRYMKSRQRWRSRHVPLEADGDEFALRTAQDPEQNPRARLLPLLAGLSPAERRLLVQRLVLAMGWSDIAREQLAPHAAGDAAVERESARLRKRYQLLLERLRARWARA